MFFFYTDLEMYIHRLALWVAAKVSLSTGQKDATHKVNFNFLYRFGIVFAVHVNPVILIPW
jgi:hypothetical protein